MGTCNTAGSTKNLRKYMLMAARRCRSTRLDNPEFNISWKPGGSVTICSAIRLMELYVPSDMRLYPFGSTTKSTGRMPDSFATLALGPPYFPPFPAYCQLPTLSGFNGSTHQNFLDNGGPRHSKSHPNHHRRHNSA